MTSSRQVISTRVRVAGFQAALLLAAFVVSGLLTWVAINVPLDRGLDNRIRRETEAVSAILTSRPLPAAIAAVQRRERRPAGFDWRLEDAAGRHLGGDLPDFKADLGFDTLDANDFGKRDVEHPEAWLYRAQTTQLPNGWTLTIAQNLAPNRQLRDQFLRSFFFTSGAALLIALAVGLSFVTRVLGRIDRIAQAADAITAGDLAQRAPVANPRRPDDIDQLAITLNRMLDRIVSLLASVRQVSDDVAHDLRTPLTHLKQRIETALSSQGASEDYRAALEGASDKIDEVLATFEALLRIGQLEAGANLAAFHRFDLAEAAGSVVEAYRPSAEDADYTLALDAPHPAVIEGDRSLIMQMIANLVENALTHTPEGSRIEIRVQALGERVRLIVEDDGPGVPAAEREAIFRRFYRVERSRTTPGSGLGLSVVAAVAKAHNALLRAEDADPGLRVVVDFHALLPESAGDLTPRAPPDSGTAHTSA